MHRPSLRGPALPARRPAPASASPAPPLTPRPHPSVPFFHLPSFFPALSALCSVQPAAALWTSPLHGLTPIPAGPLDSPTCISFLIEASPLEPDHAEPLGDPLRPRAHHGRNPRRGVHAGHARPKSRPPPLFDTPAAPAHPSHHAVTTASQRRRLALLRRSRACCATAATPLRRTPAHRSRA